MATNTNTSSSTNTSNNTSILSSDIYDISNFVDTIRSNNLDDSSDTASIVGIFGYMNEIFSQTLQNTLIVVSETSNETISSKAKFSKNIIAHALNLGITNITATPAVMTLMIYLPVNYIESNFISIDKATGKAKFLLDKDIPIFVDKYEFHLDYDIIITRTKLATGKYQYSAMYDLFESGTANIKQNNLISNITNPYITTLVNYTMNDTDFIAFSIKAHQVSNVYKTKTILTNNPIENKTITFEFDDQLASFDLDVEENGVITHLTPVYSGLIDYEVDDNKWCSYEYLNQNTIRVKFDRDSFEPSMNAIVTVNIKLTDGSNGNFTYNQNFRMSLQSEKYNNYNGMYMLVYPLQNGVSNGGKDKKSISDLKKIIPREASSRGAVINTTDLNNYFNSINDNDCKMYFYKKRDNPFERLYYTHMLVKKNSYILPTNTLNLKLLQDDFKGNSSNNNLSINPGTVFYYYDHGSDEDNDYATLYPPQYVEDIDGELDYNITTNIDGDDKRVFEYISPFLITIDKDLISSYLLTIMNDNKTFKFDSINTASDLQFVATNMDWNRKFIYDYTDEHDKKKTGVYDNKYSMTVSATQNNNLNYNLVLYHFNANGDMIFDDIRVKMFMVLYSDETSNTPYRYIEGELDTYDYRSYIYNFKFELETDDLMDLNNRINIKGVYNAKPEEFQKTNNLEVSHGYLNRNTYARIFILSDFGTKPGDKVNGTTITEETAKMVLYGDDGIGNRTELESILPIEKDISDEFLKNNIHILKNSETVNVVSIIKNNRDYLNMVKNYNKDEQETESAILKFIRNNKNGDFIQNTLLKDTDVIEVIKSYNYEDLSRYTVCNTFSIDNGVDFYYDYSNIMRSNIAVKQIQEKDNDNKPIYKEITRSDSYGNSYSEFIPIYKVNKDGAYYYEYTVKRIPMIKNGYIATENKMQDFIYSLEERRKYINECLNVLEDTFGIDLKFFNTFGPSRMFYYEEPNSTAYKVKITVEQTNVLSITVDEDNPAYVVGTLYHGNIVLVDKVKGQWGHITSPINGWIKLSNANKLTNYVDNVALNMRFALEAETSGDKYIGTNIIRDIKEFIEDINTVSELHIPNIITLITNNYRERLVYFEYLGLNSYASSCQHLYLDSSKDIDTCPEFLNIATRDDGADTPDVSITVY